MSTEKFRFVFAVRGNRRRPGNAGLGDGRRVEARELYCGGETGGRHLNEVGILIIDDDVVSQRALKNVLDSEGWRVRIVAAANLALPELATGNWNLAIADTALVDPRGPIFAILRELAQADPLPAEDGPEAPEGEEQRKRLRTLFLVRTGDAKRTMPVLEEEALPYLMKPYHLHDFLEKVSELLVEAGAIDEPLRGIGDFSRVKKRKRRSAVHGAPRDAMFAPRRDYQMTEEEMAEWERQEEDDRKKREKEAKERYH
jgi:CheY-like chemotaxis protein